MPVYQYVHAPLKFFVEIANADEWLRSDGVDLLATCCMLDELGDLMKC